MEELTHPLTHSPTHTLTHSIANAMTFDYKTSKKQCANIQYPLSSIHYPMMAGQIGYWLLAVGYFHISTLNKYPISSIHYPIMAGQKTKPENTPLRGEGELWYNMCHQNETEHVNAGERKNVKQAKKSLDKSNHI